MSTELTAPTAKPPGRARAHFSLSRKNRIGLVLTFLMGLANIPSVLEGGAPQGEEGPPMGVLVLDSICGVVMVVACFAAWRSGCRRAIRLAAGATILQALSAMPALFVDVPPAIKVLVAVAVVLTFVSVVLMLSPGRRAAAVTD